MDSLAACSEFLIFTHQMVRLSSRRFLPSIYYLARLVLRWTFSQTSTLGVAATKQERPFQTPNFLGRHTSIFSRRPHNTLSPKQKYVYKICNVTFMRLNVQFNETELLFLCDSISRQIGCSSREAKELAQRRR